MRGQMTHLDTSVLAEFRAGLITGRRGARIAAHLAGCGRCTALDARLAGVSALLASVPAPAVPEKVAERLDTVLAAEVARRDDPERSRREQARESASSPRRAGSGGFRLMSLRVLAPVAAAVLAAGGYGLSQIPHGPGSQVTASSAGSAPSASSAAKAANRAEAPPASARSAPSAMPAFPAQLIVVTIRTDFLKATLEQQLAAALRVTPAASAEHPATARMRACVQLVSGGASVIRVYSAHFEGQPATIIVARSGHGEKAWVAGANCSGTDRDVIQQTSLP